MSRRAKAVSALFSKRLAPTGMCIALSPMFFGCFDAKVVSTDDAGGAGGSGSNLPALLIDDFEDGNRVPSDPQFGPWRCYAFTNPEGSDPTCKVSTPGYNNSEHGFYADFELVDTNNHRLDYPGVVLHTQTTSPLDVSPYENIVFSVKLEPKDKPLPPPLYLAVNLGCSTIVSSATNSGVLSIGTGVQPTSDWQSLSLPLASFSQAPWASDELSIDAKACAKQVDELSLQYVLQYAEADASADGETLSGTLTIDDVYLQ